jgi:hypothetical protein
MWIVHAFYLCNPTWKYNVHIESKEQGYGNPVNINWINEYNDETCGEITSF